MPVHKAEINIQAPPQKVFEALTQPNFVKLWQYGRVLDTDWQVGSKIHFRSEAQGSFEVLEQYGTVLDVKPNELIKYSLYTPQTGTDDTPEHYNITTYALCGTDGGTRIELIQEDNRPHGFAPPTLRRILAALKNIVESNKY